MIHTRHSRIGIALAILLTASMLATGVVWHQAQADESVDELRDKIDQSKQELADIDREIERITKELNVVGAEKNTLNAAIRELNLSRDKVQAQITSTQKRINSTDLEIEELEREIYVKELEIDKNKDAVAESFRSIDQLENQTIIELLLGYESMADVWDAIEEQTLLTESLREDIRVLSALKDEYTNAKNRSLVKRGELGELKEELSGERGALDNTIYQKDILLEETEGEEAAYQRQLAAKKAARAEYERLLSQYESQLQFILDPSSIPAAGSGVLRWPIEAGFMSECLNRTGTFGNKFCITQYFGNTAFAQSGAYNGQGHNGVDFGTPVGTKITAALAGTVTATGNTDQAYGCYSYGKWVLIRHGNGLSTLYAHLSSVSVQKGQTVGTGQLVGYSGNTGYSTGPHLHFTVYATEGVQVQKLGDIPGRPVTACSPVSIPVAGYEAYLNPLNYL